MNNKVKRRVARVMLATLLVNSVPIISLADSPNSGPQDVVVTNKVSVDLSLDEVESELEQLNVKQDSANTIIGTISKNVDGTNTYLAHIQDNTGETNDLLAKTNVLLNDIKGLMGTKGTASVTEVYSINNEIDTCYYKPSLNDVHMLEEYVLATGFANAYTGFFDLNHTSPYTANTESRALEILGYDYLLSSESYDGNTYSAERITGGISKQTALMNVYKAIGQEIQQVQLYYSPVNKSELINSPAIKDLSWIVNNIDSSRGKTKAFITRTNPELYVKKAQSDLHLSSDAVSSTTPITLGEFIVLVASMMDFYGEPVISDAEMSALLQVFGGSIPTSLSGAQKSAYVYLRSRGILTDEYKVFSGNLRVDDMCNILMRVKDVDSRQNLKEIQITMDISDKLKSAGYFPKTVSLNSDKKSIQVDKEYYYKDAVYYDYLIDKESTGFKGNNVFIPVDIDNYLTSKTLSGSEYKGIDTIDGKEYYHFKITLAAPNTDYFNTVKSFTGTDNTFLIAEADSDHFVAVPQGGGIYTINKSQGGVYTTDRKQFTSNTAKYIDKERKEDDSESVKESASIKDVLRDVFEPLIVKAAPATSAPSISANNTASNGINVKITVHNWSNIKKNYDAAAIQADPWLQTQTAIYSQANVNTDDTAVVVLPSNSVDTFLQYIERDDTLNTVNPAVTAIANVSGETLLKVDDLVNMGLVYKTTDVWKAVDPVVLDTKYGRVVLDQADHLVVAGTTMYRVPEDTVLYTSNLLEGSFYVDFRAIYGWSANIANITITGNQGAYAVNVDSIVNQSKNPLYTPLKEYNLKITPVFDNSSNSTNKALFVESNLITQNEMFVLASNYSLSNWMILEGPSADYLYIFYHKDAFESLGLTPPDGLRSMKSKCYPYSSIDSDNWVVREVEITKVKNTEPGKMYYDEKFGYLYNVPDVSQFTMEAYLNGELLLPIYSDTSSRATAYNANVNIWSGYEYGSRPSDNNGSTQAIKWDGTKSSAPTNSSVVQMKATPAGVQALFGNIDITSVTKSNIDAFMDDAKTQAMIGIYYGTSKLQIEDAGGNNYLSLQIGSGTAPNGTAFDSYKKAINVTDNNAFYEMAKWQISVGNQDIYRRYICFDAIKQTAVEDDVLPEDELDVRQKTVIEDGGFDNSYGGFEEFSLQWILDQIDEGSNLVLVIAVKILPMIALIALTLLVGFVFMADSKIVQKIMNKFFDPIKVLTLGHKTIADMSKKKCLVSLMIGYILFIFVADGNILRLIVLCSTIVGKIMHAIR